MAVIAISGKKQVGKDTVGKIIQYLIDKQCVDYDEKDTDINYWKEITFEKYLQHNMCFSGWKNKKFADKLKDLVCLLIGCTREQLEDEEFKNTELGEEWWMYQYLLHERVQDEIGNFRTNRKTGEPLVRMLKSPLTHKHIAKPLSKKQFEKMPIKDRKFHNASIIKPTPRFLLQNIGTDLFRNQLHPNIWVNSLMSEYQIIRSGMGNRQPDDLDDIPMEYPNWIITDMRFPNELEAVKERNGLTIRVNRDQEQVLLDKGIVIPKHLQKKDEHPSETALDNAEFDYVIDNDGTLEELIEKVKQILIKEKII